MQDHIAQLVHPVFHYGLELRQRLQRGESPDLEAEQTALKDLLLSDLESRGQAEFGADPLQVAHGFTDAPDPTAPNRGQFLGIRYALVCWLDELFTTDRVWQQAWNERKLEVELYGSSDRAWKFWQQASLAQARPSTDALEAMYLCVALGFRGQLRDQGERLQPWIAAAKLRLGKVQEVEWPYAAEPEPPTNVPPLHGHAQFRRMVVTGWVALLLFIPMVSFLIVHRLAQ